MRIWGANVNFTMKKNLYENMLFHEKYFIDLFFLFQKRFDWFFLLNTKEGFFSYIQALICSSSPIKKHHRSIKIWLSLNHFTL